MTWYEAAPMKARAVLLSVALVAGCGSDEDPDKGPSASQQVRATVQAYDRALGDGDARKACGLTYIDFPRGGGRDRAPTEDELDACAKDTRQELRYRPTSGYEIRSLRVRGNSATVTIAAPSRVYEEPPRSRLRLRRFGDSWKIAFQPA